FNVLDHSGYIYQKLTATPDWLAEAGEVDELLDWMLNHPTEPGAVVSNNPGLVYLRTGRKAVASSDPALNRSRWQALGVRYVVAVRPTTPPDPSLEPRML